MKKAAVPKRKRGLPRRCPIEKDRTFLPNDEWFRMVCPICVPCYRAGCAEYDAARRVLRLRDDDGEHAWTKESTEFASGSSELHR